MLVLTRKIGERLVIGEGVVVAVVAARGSKIRLGIEAAAEVAIKRGEIGSVVAAETTLSPRKKKLPGSSRCGANPVSKEEGR